MSGVFAVHRGVFEHPLFADEPFTEREAWLWLLSQAAWRKHRARVRNGTAELERGQLAFATRFMARKWQWSEARVRRFLTRLKTDAMIDARGDARTTLITICNYDKYQKVSMPRDAQGDAENDAHATRTRRKEESIQSIQSSSLRSDEAHTSEPTPSRKPSPRGTRIPDDYEPDLSEATARGASLQQAAEEAEKFRDWAIAAPGQKGVKLDWPATWRNWCRRADWKQTRGPPAKDGFAQVLNELNGTSHEPDHHDDNIIEAIATQPGFGANDGCDAERGDTGERGGHAPAGQGTETRRQAGA